MKRLILTGLVLVAFGQLPADAQNRKKVQDDIYYNADDAKKEAEEKAVEQQAYEAEMRRQQEQENANNTSSDYELDYTGEESEYIDYDDDDYTYANRFNRFNSPYYGGSYWAYDPFWYGGGWGYGAGWGWGSGWGIGVGYGGPYWSSYWGWNSWYGYPGFYSVWNSPYYGGWGYGGWGYGGGYYNGFYDGYYAGAYNNGIGGRSVNYGPRSSMNRYPGSTRASGMRSTNATRSQLRMGNNNGTGEIRQAPNSNGSRSYSERMPSAEAGGRAVERRAPSGGNYSERSYPSENARGIRNQQGAAPRQYNSGGRGTMQQSEVAPQRSERSFQRSEQPSYQRSEPSYQRSQPSYSAPSRSYSAPSSSPGRSSGGGSFGGGSRGGGGRR